MLETSAIPEAQLAAARAFESLFVPALFRQWAPRLADAAGLAPGQAVLDVATGTGVLAREARSRVGPSGRVVGLDLAPGMLAVASEVEPAIDWQQGSAESLPFPDASFDAVVSQFGLMFMDADRAIGEMLRVLRPNGHLAVAVWDSLENIPAYAAEVELLDRSAGAPAANALRAPFVLGDPERLAALFRDAGAKQVAVANLAGTARFPSIRVMMEADLRGWLPLVGVELSEEQIARILREAEAVFAPYRTADGQAEFEVRALLVTAVRA